MSAKKVNTLIPELFASLSIVFLLALSSVNLEKYFTPTEVLGVDIDEQGNEIFWNEFLSKNPDYIPGWIEIGKWERVIEIDPNFLLD